MPGCEVGMYYGVKLERHMVLRPGESFATCRICPTR